MSAGVPTLPNLNLNTSDAASLTSTTSTPVSVGGITFGDVAGGNASSIPPAVWWIVGAVALVFAYKWVKS